MSLLDILAYIISPPKCASCGDTLGLAYLDSPLCKSCAEDFKRECAEPCTRCKKPICECICSAQKLQESACLFHVKLAFYYGRTRDRAINRMVYSMKQYGDKALFDFLADRLLDNSRKYIEEAVRLTRARKVILTYVPRSRNAVIKYGHDQARLLAEALAERLGYECIPLVKRNKRANDVMKKLSYSERFEKAKDAYIPLLGADGLEGCFTVIVDDVVTSGASVLGVAKIAKEMKTCGFGVVSAGSSKYIET